MTSWIIFIGVSAILVHEGTLLARYIIKENGWLLPLSLSLIIAAVCNVFLITLWTMLDVSLTPTSLLVPHFLALFFLAFVTKKIQKNRKADTSFYVETSKKYRWLDACCITIIGVVLASSFIHAVLLPTFQYDSATNWTMRSEISFYDQRIAFDETEERGMAKPQYPFLFHALQITANQGQGMWNDTAANTILWLLSFCCFSALYLILRKVTSKTIALLTLTLIMGIPLLSLHLGQGYADITLTQALLLSLACILAWIQRKEKKWIILSAIFVASSVWTKSEGLFLGLIPWVIAVIAIVLFDRNRQKDATISLFVAGLLSLPWLLFSWSRGLLLTPHSSDTMIGFHAEGVVQAFLGLFDRGSFGITWYIVCFGILFQLFNLKKIVQKKKSIDCIPLAWGIFVLIEILFIYLWTPNVRFLLNGESYYRQMMLPASMLLLAYIPWLANWISEDQTSEGNNEAI